MLASLLTLEVLRKLLGKRVCITEPDSSRVSGTVTSVQQMVHMLTGQKDDRLFLISLNRGLPQYIHPDATVEVLEKETEDSCGTCRFYFHGLCKRFPPTPVYTGGDSMLVGWPVVDNSEWCGEHREKEV